METNEEKIKKNSFDTDEKELRLMGFGQNAEGAIKIGTKVIKSYSDPTDINKNGDEGTIKGSKNISFINDDITFKKPQILVDLGIDPIFHYFIEWDNYPGKIGFILDYKIKIK